MGVAKGLTRRGKAHTAAIIAVLGIAIGLSTTVFGVVDALLLRPVPARYPERTVSAGRLAWVPSFEDPILWWGQARSFDILARYESGLANEGDEQTLQGVRVTAVTPCFFMFSVCPLFRAGFLRKARRCATKRLR